jgi:hypothetical protein
MPASSTGSKTLATSGLRWGLSCEVADEASMGVILGYMKLFGAVDIGFAPLGPLAKRKRRKDPAAVARGKLSATVRKRKREQTASRKPLTAAAEEFVSGLSRSEFRYGEFTKAMAKAGWEGSATLSRALAHLVGTKRVKKKSRGVYTKLPALVKQAG